MRVHEFAYAVLKAPIFAFKSNLALLLRGGHFLTATPGERSCQGLFHSSLYSRIMPKAMRIRHPFAIL